MITVFSFDVAWLQTATHWEDQAHTLEYQIQFYLLHSSKLPILIRSYKMPLNYFENKEKPNWGKINWIIYCGGIA